MARPKALPNKIKGNDKMKLLTKAIKNKLPRIYKTDGIPSKEKIAVCKFFNPAGHGTWYAIEGEQQGDDFIFFGVHAENEIEFCYFSLNELESARYKCRLVSSKSSLYFPVKIERDTSFFPGKLKSIEQLRTFVGNT